MTETSLTDALEEVSQGDVTIEWIREIAHSLSIDLGQNISMTASL